MNIKAVVLDFGGVLVRTATRSSRIEWENRLGLSDNELDHIVFNSKVAAEATIGKATIDDIWLYVQKHLNLTAEQLEQLIIDFWKEDFLDHDLIQVLNDLMNSFTTAILSNIWTGARQFFQSNYGIQEGLTVDKLFLSCEMGLAKPDPKIYMEMATALDVKLGEILFIDDNYDNVFSANALGMKTHQFSDPKTAISILTNLL